MILATTGEWLLNCLMDFHKTIQDVNFSGVRGQYLLSTSRLHKHKGRIGAKPSLDFLCKDMCCHLTCETRKQSNACLSLIHSVK